MIVGHTFVLSWIFIVIAIPSRFRRPNLKFNSRVCFRGKVQGDTMSNTTLTRVQMCILKIFEYTLDARDAGACSRLESNMS